MVNNCLFQGSFIGSKKNVKPFSFVLAAAMPSTNIVSIPEDYRKGAKQGRPGRQVTG
jgi:hypothetical protein